MGALIPFFVGAVIFWYVRQGCAESQAPDSTLWRNALGWSLALALLSACLNGLQTGPEHDGAIADRPPTFDERARGAGLTFLFVFVPAALGILAARRSRS
jgi:hypothetical protein